MAVGGGVSELPTGRREWQPNAPQRNARCGVVAIKSPCVQRLMRIVAWRRTAREAFSSSSSGRDHGPMVTTAGDVFPVLDFSADIARVRSARCSQRASPRVRATRGHGGGGGPLVSVRG